VDGVIGSFGVTAPGVCRIVDRLVDVALIWHVGGEWKMRERAGRPDQ
jgi:hypothetical protein